MHTHYDTCAIRWLLQRSLVEHQHAATAKTLIVKPCDDPGLEVRVTHPPLPPTQAHARARTHARVHTHTHAHALRAATRGWRCADMRI
jgi:hypothetical protein